MQHQLSTASCQMCSDCSDNTDISSNQCLLGPTDFVTSPTLWLQCRGDPKCLSRLSFIRPFRASFIQEAISEITEHASLVWLDMENNFGHFSREKLGRNFEGLKNSTVPKSGVCQ